MKQVAALAVGLLAAALGVPAWQPAAESRSFATAAAEAPCAAAPADGEEAPLPKEALARVGSPRLRHGGEVLDLAYSPDGRRLASAAADRTARVWDAATGRLVRRFPIKDDGPVRVAFADGGKALAILDADSYRAFDLATGERLRAHPLPPAIGVNPGFGRLSLGISPDGSSYVVGVQEERRRLFDGATGRVLREVGEAEALLDPVFSPDGRRLALVPEPVVEMAPRPRLIRQMTRVYDTAGGRRLYDLPVGTPVFSPDGKYLLLLPPVGDGKDTRVDLYDAASGKFIRNLRGVAHGPLCAAFSPDGRRLALGNSEHEIVQFVDAVTGEELRRIRCYLYATRVVFSPDGRTVAAAAADGALRLWDAATGRARLEYPEPDGSVFLVRFAAGGRRLLTVAGSISSRDWRTGGDVRRHPDPRGDFRHGFSLSPDSTRWAACDPGGVVRIADFVTGEDVRTLRGHGRDVTATLLSPDGKTLFSLGEDDTVRVWDVASGRELHRLAVPLDSSIGWLAVSPDGRLLATCTAESQGKYSYVVRLWDVRTGRESLRLPPTSGPVFGLGFSPDGARVACTCCPDVRQIHGPSEVLLYDLAGGREPRRLTGHRSEAYHPTFSPDGRTLATAGHDMTVRLWEVASGRERHRFTGHEGGVSALAFSDDGALLAAASSDAPVFVWDVLDSARQKSGGTLTDAEAAGLWSGLTGGDTRAAFDALRGLLGHPADAVRLVRRHVRPVAAEEVERVRRLVKALDGDRYAERERAAAALRDVIDLAEDELRAARRAAGPADLQRRLDALLKQADLPSAARIRQSRALELLEHLATPEAFKYLDELAAGAPSARLSREAAAARERIRRRS